MHPTGMKRKERDFDTELMSQETNINVVVRCRGRSDREVKENSGVVVKTEGVKGNVVELSMGPSALSNKTYNFDRVFSPAADQGMVFDEVVSPILDEVWEGPALYGTGGKCSYFTGRLGIQLHDFRLRSDRYGKDLYHVW